MFQEWLAIKSCRALIILNTPEQLLWASDISSEGGLMTNVTAIASGSQHSYQIYMSCLQPTFTDMLTIVRIRIKVQVL